MSLETLMNDVDRRLAISNTQMIELYEVNPDLKKPVVRSDNCTVAKDAPRALGGASKRNLNNLDVLKTSLELELNSFLKDHPNYHYVQPLASVYAAAIASTNTLSDARKVVEALVNMNLHMQLLDFNDKQMPAYLGNLTFQVLETTSPGLLRELPTDCLVFPLFWPMTLFLHDAPNQETTSHLIHYWINQPGYAASYVAASLIHNRLSISCAAPLKAWKETRQNSDELVSCFQNLPTNVNNWSAAVFNDATNWMTEHPPTKPGFDGQDKLMSWMKGEQQHLQADPTYDQSAFTVWPNGYWIVIYVTVPAVTLMLVYCWIKRRRSASKQNVDSYSMGKSDLTI